MIDADADLVLAIHHLRSKLLFDIDFRHVYGHQDGKGKAKKKKQDEKKQKERELREKEAEATRQLAASMSPAERSVLDLFLGKSGMPQTILPATSDDSEPSTGSDSDDGQPPSEEKPQDKKLSDEAQMNVACDKQASCVTDGALQGLTTSPSPILTLPYPGSRAMLRIKKRWITAKYKKELYDARRTKYMRIYCMEKYGWDDETFDSIHWESVSSVRSKMTGTQQMQTMKIMHGWLPIMHMRHHITGVNQCPGCKHTDETMTHLFQCPNAAMKERRTKVLDNFLKQGKKHKIPQHIIEAVCRVLRVQCLGSNDFESDSHTPDIAHAIQQQRRIGTHMMLRGYLANGWMTALENAGVEHPDRKMNALQRLIWSDFVTPIWTERNDILHRRANTYKTADDERMAERIIWYVDHKSQLLSHHDQFLARHDTTTISSMPRRVKREWIRVLEKARACWMKEKDLRRKGQQTIMRYMGLTEPSSEAIT